MEKREYCFDYIRGNCDNLKCHYGHVIVKNKEEFFLKKHEQRIRVNISEVREYKPSFADIQTKNNTSKKKISKCVICQRGFLVSQDLIESGDPASLKCGNCLKNV
jgi:hypothetical protein